MASIYTYNLINDAFYFPFQYLSTYFGDWKEQSEQLGKVILSAISRKVSLKLPFLSCRCINVGSSVCNKCWYNHDCVNPLHVHCLPLRYCTDISLYSQDLYLQMWADEWVMIFGFSRNLFPTAISNRTAIESRLQARRNTFGEYSK